AKGQVYFQLRDTVLVAQLLEGNYPDYAQLIPRSHTTRAVMTTSELRAACRAADIFARESSFSVRVSVKPGSELKPGNVELDARSAETGSNEVQVSATVEGAALDIAFNVKYLADVLNVISSESVALELSGSNAPGVVRPLGNDDFLSVIMPMHLGG
ncbi:MAG: DNA polymerase III subunit beta, partial [Chloroflexi bacterium]